MDVIAKNELIQKAGDLKVLPFVAKKVIETISDENSSATQLSSVIEKDQTISARILKISNSALYGVRQEITSLNQAVVMLGSNVIQSLVLAVSTRSLYKRFGMMEQLMWDHSIGTAIAARLIAAKHGRELAEVAFIGGLMHDVGKVIMNNEAGAAFIEVMKRTYNHSAASLDAEEAICGYNHTEIGSKVVTKWGFPPILVQIISKHHLDRCILEDILDPFTAKAIAAVALANTTCKVLGVGYRGPNETTAIHDHPALSFLDISPERLDELVEEARETYQSEKALFQ
ncbi:MAG: HDOD domain-containing protein [Thermodesulfobacteriota bacterium]